MLYFLVASMTVLFTYAQPVTKKPDLPTSVESHAHCVENVIALKDILDTLESNPKSDHQFDGYRRAIHGDLDSDIVARLIYAETQAANCPELNNEIMPLIAASISRRVSKRHGNVRSVVFQRDQFSSALKISLALATKTFCAQRTPYYGQKP